MSTLIDLVSLPFVFLSAIVMKFYRRRGAKKMPLNTRLLQSIGVFPIRNHYYEPQFDHRQLKSLREPRHLPGLDFDLNRQLALLDKLNYQRDFQTFLTSQDVLPVDMRFIMDNGSFGPGDAEFLFNLLRYLKPVRVVEIGCGSSTKIISAALQLNKAEQSFSPSHTCIEPYEQPWLDKFPNIRIERRKIEEMDLDWLEKLSAGDLLFIDSSHIIRPQGDVLHEYLSIIPSLASGVFVHVHDIFSPRDYPDAWIRENISFWNEQYLLEASLSNNAGYEIVAALNYLKHASYDSLKRICPSLRPESELGSFYFRTR